MFRIAALNDGVTGGADVGEEDEEEASVGPSREVLESTAHSDHSAAIRQLACGDQQQAEQTFFAVLANPYVNNAQLTAKINAEGKGLPPELTLKYSCYKNIAHLYMKMMKYQDACDYYLKAMQLDASEVGVCHRLGAAAIKLRDFELALIAFQEGLRTSPQHLICLDQLLSVLLVLGQHYEVLAISATILRRHPCHAKARGFTRYVLERLPYLASDIRYFCQDSEVLFETNVEYDETAAEKYIATCLSLRPTIKVTDEPVEREPVTQALILPLTSLTWHCLATALLHTYDRLDQTDPCLLTARLTVETSLEEFDRQQAEKRAEEERAAAAKKKPGAVSKRRLTTIEAGDSQDTFRMEHLGEEAVLDREQLHTCSVGNEALANVAGAENDEASRPAQGSANQKDDGSRSELKLVVKGTGTATTYVVDAAVLEKYDKKEVKSIKSSGVIEGDLLNGKRMEVTLNSSFSIDGNCNMEVEKEDVNKNIQDRDKTCLNLDLESGREKLVQNIKYNNTSTNIANTNNRKRKLSDETNDSEVKKIKLDECNGEISKNELQNEQSHTEINKHKCIIKENNCAHAELPNPGETEPESCKQYSDNMKSDEVGKNDEVKSDELVKGDVNEETEGRTPTRRRTQSSDLCEEEPDTEETETTVGEEEEEEEEEELQEDDEMVDEQVQDENEQEGEEEQAAAAEIDIELLNRQIHDACQDTAKSWLNDVAGKGEDDDSGDGGGEDGDGVVEDVGCGDGNGSQSENMSHDDSDQENGGEDPEEPHLDETIQSLCEEEADVASEEEEGSAEDAIADVAAEDERSREEDAELLARGDEDNDRDMEEQMEVEFNQGMQGGEKADSNKKSLDDKQDDSVFERGDSTRKASDDKINCDCETERKTTEDEHEKSCKITIENRGKSEEINDFEISKDHSERDQVAGVCSTASKDKSEKDKGETSDDKESSAKGVEKNSETSDEKDEAEKEEDARTDTCDDKTESATDGTTDVDDDGEKLSGKIIQTRNRRRSTVNEAATLDTGGGATKATATATASIGGESTGGGRTGCRVRRGKRGLERELQQLDHWGRRAESGSGSGGGGSKRRRRVGHDGITAAHLLRSFVPAALLGSSSCSPEKSCSATAIAEVAEFIEATKIVENSDEQLAKENEAGQICSQQRGDKEKENNGQPKSGLESEKPMEESEKVREFLVGERMNDGVLGMLGSFLEALTLHHRHHTVWPTPDAAAMLALYPRYRESVQLSSPLSLNTNVTAALRRHCVLALIHWELAVSHAHVVKGPVPQRFRGEDLLQLSLLLGRGDVTEVAAPHYKQRFSWLQAQLHLADDDPDAALPHLYQVVEECEDLGLTEVVGRRVAADGRRATHARAHGLLKSLLRRQLVEQVEEEFAAGNLGVVVEVVAGELAEDSGCEFSDEQQRNTHCELLLRALLATKDYRGLFEWGSVVLEQEMKQLQQRQQQQLELQQQQDPNVSEDEEEERDERMLQLVMHAFEEAVDNDEKIVSSLSPAVAVRVVAGLIAVLVQQLEGPSVETTVDASVWPWLLLHRILLHHELAANTPTPRPSTLLLVTAHDELAKQDRCCSNDGRLLQYSLKVLLEELATPGLLVTTHISLSQARDQATHCLYHLPTRRNKRGVRDHGSPGVALRWSEAVTMYTHYCPEPPPEFQSATPPSLAEDSATLFMRFLELLPAQHSINERLKKIEDFINGKTEKVGYDDVSQLTHPLPGVYYYLADYHFKNKEWSFAIEFYKQDLAVNPTRLDSWAGFALAQKTQLETKLNSCDIIEDEEQFLKDADKAVICFQQALKQDKNHSNLWVEYGGLVYMMHSHPSRLLKQDLNPDISIEMYQLLEDTKAKMLIKAEECFSRALELSEADEDWDDERWLYHYMLGKIGEKNSDPPKKVINQYLTAANYLHLNTAKYPVKINYNNPQDLSVEALEMYFRVHSYIIKYLEQRDSKLVTKELINYFLSITEELLKGHFSIMTEYEYSDNSINDIQQENSDSSRNRKFIELMVSNIIDGAYFKATKFISANSCIEEIEVNPSAAKSNSIEEKNQGSDDEIMVVEETLEQKNRKTVILRCLQAFNLCLTRFPHHYKSLYRLAQYYHTTKVGKDNNKTRNFLMGCSLWQRVEYMHVNGLFNERKIWYQQPKNCNLFHGVWRIPNDEIDRPGSFAAHMYRCVCLALDVLPVVNDFLITLDIGLALKVTPDKDKKYLRENERQLLCEHATQVGLQAMKDRFKMLFKSSIVIHRNRRLAFVFDVFRCYKHLSRHLPGTESSFGAMLGQSYGALETITADSQALLRKAESYCTTHNMAGQVLNLGNQAGRGRNKRILSIVPVGQHPEHPTFQPRQQYSSPGGTRSLAAPAPRSTAAPVPRMSATPVPRLSASPLPRATAAPQQRSSAIATSTPQQRSSATATLPSSATATSQLKSGTFAAAETGGDKAVRAAYKIYENLIQFQSQASKPGNLKPSYKAQLEGYQKQLLQYLKIPSVSQYFQKSLQQVGNATSKLPPPPMLNPVTQTTTLTPVKSVNNKDNRRNTTNEKTSDTNLNVTQLNSNSKSKPVTSKPQVISLDDSDDQSDREKLPPKPIMSVTLSPVKKTSTEVESSKTKSSAAGNVKRSSQSSSNSQTSKSTVTVTVTPTVVPPTKVRTQQLTKTPSSNKSRPSLPRGLSATTMTQKPTSGKQQSTKTNSTLQAGYTVALKPSEASAIPGSLSTASKPSSIEASSGSKSTIVQLNTEELMKLAYAPVQSPTKPPNVNRRLEFGANVGNAVKHVTPKVLTKRQQPPQKKQQVSQKSQQQMQKPQQQMQKPQQQMQKPQQQIQKPQQQIQKPQQQMQKPQLQMQKFQQQNQKPQQQQKLKPPQQALPKPIVTVSKPKLKDSLKEPLGPGCDPLTSSDDYIITLD